MKPFATLFAKEVKSLFCAPINYLVIAAFLALTSYRFNLLLLIDQRASLDGAFGHAAVLMLIVVPIISTGSFAGERSAGTLELLLTAPVRDATIVLAKFFACLALIGVMLALTLVYPVILNRYAQPDWGPIVSGYAGLMLLAAALIGAGLAVSAVSASQVAATIVSIALFVFFWLIDFAGAVTAHPFDQWLSSSSLRSRFDGFALGSLNLSDVGYFLSVAVLGLFFSVRTLARR